MRFFNVPTFYGADLFHPFLKLEVSKKKLPHCITVVPQNLALIVEVRLFLGQQTWCRWPSDLGARLWFLFTQV